MFLYLFKVLYLPAVAFTWCKYINYLHSRLHLFFSLSMIRKVGLFGFQTILNTIISVGTEISKVITSMDIDISQVNTIMLIIVYYFLF